MKEKKFLPEGYEYLKLGEPIQVDDYYWSSKESQWVLIKFPDDTSNWTNEHVIRKKEDVRKHRRFR